MNELRQFRMDYPNDPPQQIRKHLGNMGVTGAACHACTIDDVW